MQTNDRKICMIYFEFLTLKMSNWLNTISQLNIFMDKWNLQFTMVKHILNSYFD